MSCLFCMAFKWAALSDFFNYTVLPYINGISQPLTRLLEKHDIRVVNKPLKTLQQEFPSPKSRPPIDLQSNVVYKISCADCPWSYVGENGRCFETRRKEHMRNIKSYARGNIAKHAWSENHYIDFYNSQVIDKVSSRIRKTLESWHTASIILIMQITIQGRSLINAPFFKKVVKENMTADPSSNAMNYAKFTGALAGSIALKQYLEHQKILLENNYFFLYGQRCIDDWRRVSQRRCFHRRQLCR